jgi:hypothetical protein
MQSDPTVLPLFCRARQGSTIDQTADRPDGESAREPKRRTEAANRSGEPKRRTRYPACGARAAYERKSNKKSPAYFAGPFPVLKPEPD